jgi:D-glycero-D-manno-heptose 1,7-bisphosphate phosphatase
MNRAAFLDRDGVINQKPPEGKYVTRWEEMHLLPGVASAIALLNKAGFCVIGVTNQRCVAKNLVSATTLQSMHQRLCAELAAKGATIDAIYFCPHEKDQHCHCRKPAAGMLIAAALVHGINLAASWMIGDSEIDMEAGRKAGCRTARILNKHETVALNSDIFGRSLLDIVGRLLALEKCAALHTSQASSVRM